MSSKSCIRVGRLYDSDSDVTIIILMRKPTPLPSPHRDHSNSQMNRALLSSDDKPIPAALSSLCEDDGSRYAGIPHQPLFCQVGVACAPRMLLCSRPFCWWIEVCIVCIGMYYVRFGPFRFGNCAVLSPLSGSSQ